MNSATTGNTGNALNPRISPPANRIVIAATMIPNAMPVPIFTTAREKMR